MRQLLLTLLFLCCFLSFGQNFYPPLVNYSAKNYGKDRNPENYCVVQDHRGVMYFGSSQGVLEFDGEKWTFIQVGYGSFVRSLAVDEKGVIYVGVYGDFGYLAPDNTGQLVFKSLLDKIPEDDQFFSDIWNLYTVSNQVFFQSEEALFVYDIKEKSVEVNYPETSFHTSYLVDSTLYLRQREVGLVKYDNGNFIPLKGTELFEGYGVFGIHKLKDDSLLIITQELGMYKWKGDSIRQLPDNNIIPLTEFGVFGSVLLSDGDLALNTFTNGVLICDINGKIKRKIDREIGIRSDVVQHIYQDRDLNLWLALENGISKVNYHSPLSYFDEKTGIEGNVQCIIRYNGEIYVGTSNGLFVQDSTTFGSRKFKNTGMIRDQVWDFSIVDNTLYIATTRGMFKTTNGKKFTQINYQTANVIVYRKTKKEFVIAGSSGIVVYDRFFKEKWAYTNSFSNFMGGEIDPQDENVIWLGSVKSGAIRLTDKGNEYQFDQYMDASGLDDDLGKPIIYGDNLIFGGKYGLLSFVHEDIMFEDLKNQLTAEELADGRYTKGIFEQFALEDSLFEGQFLLLEKANNRVWYCNELKIGYYDYQLKKFENRPFWGIDFGRINEFYLEENGVLWIGAAEGLIRYEQNSLKEYKSQFYSLIRKVELSAEETLFNGVFVDTEGEFTIAQNQESIPEINYSKNDVKFLFSAPYFEDEHRPEYRHILEGDKDRWSNWELRSDVGFNNLHEGYYTFRVEARNIYGQISEQATYSFIISPPWFRTNWAYFLYLVAFVLILIIGVRISSKRLKAKNLWLEGVVEERTKEISNKNVVLEHQKKEIRDSINYAQRIQEAILPLEDEMKRWIPNSFVLFRPKDIVSGDFYWFLQRDNKLILICADCTGHGVPGAFMSMIGSDRLNNIVSENKTTSPGSILSELNRAIKKSLKQDGNKKSTRDGMDAAICTVDLTTNTLMYSGAYRSLWVVNSEKAELTEIKATKVAVAGFTPDDQVYDEHEIKLEKGMKFYMTTDGYADQFGGTRDKKYKVKNMKTFIVKNANLPFDIQKENLEKELLNWMGEAEQVDDVCVIGFEL